MYARRQRRVQSGSTNVQTLVLTTLNPDEILCANLKLYPIQLGRVSYTIHGCQGGGVATRLTADQLQPGSIPGLGFRRSAEHFCNSQKQCEALFVVNQHLK